MEQPTILHDLSSLAWLIPDAGVASQTASRRSNTTGKVVTVVVVPRRQTHFVDHETRIFGHMILLPKTARPRPNRLLNQLVEGLLLSETGHRELHKKLCMMLIQDGHKVIHRSRRSALFPIEQLSRSRLERPHRLAVSVQIQHGVQTRRQDVLRRRVLADPAKQLLVVTPPRLIMTSDLDMWKSSSPDYSYLLQKTAPDSSQSPESPRSRWLRFTGAREASG